jgi:hypothetical protein
MLPSSDMAPAQGIAAFAPRIGRRFAPAFASMRSPLRPDALRRTRTTDAVLRTVIRTRDRPDRAAAVLPPSDGSFSVIGSGDAGGRAGCAPRCLHRAPNILGG